jgi:hypothetical protein
MFLATFAGKPVQSSLSTVPSGTLPDGAISLYVPSGHEAAHGWLLMQSGDLAAIDLDALGDLTFSLVDEATNATTTRTWRGLVVVREPLCVTAAYDATQLYLVEVADSRHRVRNPYFSVPIAAMYNVSSSAGNGSGGPGVFLPDSLDGGTITGATDATPIVVTSADHGLVTGASVTITGAVGNTAANGTWTITVVDADTFSLDTSVGNGTWTSGGAWAAPWTWAAMVKDIWGNMVPQLGAAPSLPVVPADNPAGWVFYGVPAWDALFQVLRRLGCTVSADLTQPLGSQYGIVQVGGGDAELDAALAAAAPVKLWDGAYLGITRGKEPYGCEVFFHPVQESPALVPPWLGQLPPYSVSVAGPDAAGESGVYTPVWDDMLAVYSGASLTNGAALATRANEITANYFRLLRLDGGARLWQRYSGLLDIAPSSTLKSAAWRCGPAGEGFGAGVYTEVVRHPFHGGEMASGDYQDAGTAQDLVRLGLPTTAGLDTIIALTSAPFTIPAALSTVSVSIEPSPNTSVWMVPAPQTIVITDGTHTAYGLVTAVADLTDFTFEVTRIAAGSAGDTMAAGAQVIISGDPVLPIWSTTVTGVLTTSSQTGGGNKTFVGDIVVEGRTPDIGNPAAPLTLKMDTSLSLGSTFQTWIGYNPTEVFRVDIEGLNMGLPSGGQIGVYFHAQDLVSGSSGDWTWWAANASSMDWGAALQLSCNDLLYGSYGFAGPRPPTIIVSDGHNTTVYEGVWDTSTITSPTSPAVPIAIGANAKAAAGIVVHAGDGPVVADGSGPPGATGKPGQIYYDTTNKAFYFGA